MGLMKPRSWAAITVVICVVTAVLQGVALFSDPGYSVVGFERHNGVDVVTAVTPAASAAGIRIGDTIDAAGMSAPDQYHFKRAPRGYMARVVLSRGARTFAVSAPALIPRPADPLRVLTFLATAICMLLCAFVAAMRPGPMTFALALATGGTFVYWNYLPQTLTWLPGALFWAVMMPLRIYGNVYGPLIFASFAVRLPGTPPTPQKQRAIRIVDTIVLAALAVEIAREFVRPMIEGSDPVVIVYSRVFLTITLVTIAYGAYAAVRYSRREDVGRVAVVLMALLVSASVYAWANNAEISAPVTTLDLALVDISGVLVPIALAYVILRHRVFDIAFVLNRGLVYAITSGVIIVALAALEFLAEHYLAQLTHIESIAVEFGIALVVILTARLAHRQVDRFVDNALFRTRHEQEAALLQFSQTVQFYTAHDPLVRDIVRYIVQYAGVREAALYLADDNGFTLQQSAFPRAETTIDENDSALVALRAHGKHLHTHDFYTAFPGTAVYPMILIGRVVGALALGDRETGEAMPPDIHEAITRVTSASAIALASIENERIRRELAELRAARTTAS